MGDFMSRLRQDAEQSQATDPNACSVAECPYYRDRSGEFKVCLTHYVAMTPEEREQARVR